MDHGSLLDFMTDDFIDNLSISDHEIQISKDVYLGGGRIIHIGSVHINHIKKNMHKYNLSSLVEIRWGELELLQFNTENILSIFSDTRIEKLVFHGLTFSNESFSNERYNKVISRRIDSESECTLRNVTHITCYMKLNENVLKGG